MGYELILPMVIMRRCCSESSGFVSPSLSEQISYLLPYALFLSFLSLTISFLIAFAIVVPITFVIRYTKKKKEEQ